MRVARILIEEMVGETRYVAQDSKGRALALRLARASDAHRLQCGHTYAARVRALALDQGGAFLGTALGEEAFLRLDDGQTVMEGQAVTISIQSEPRADKLARGTLTAAVPDSDNEPQSRAWIASLPGGLDARIDTVPIGDPDIAAAFDDALAETVPLANGGYLRIGHTAALTAVDVDTAGRAYQGRAASRALNINSEAAAELARQISLRSLGGLIVLDCIAPLNRDSGAKVRDALSNALTPLTPRKARILAPSALGLLEMSVAWGETPLRERLGSSEGIALNGLRALQREALLAPMARLTLALPQDAYRFLLTAKLDLRGALHDRYGHRFTYVAHALANPEVFPSA